MLEFPADLVLKWESVLTCEFRKKSDLGSESCRICCGFINVLTSASLWACLTCGYKPSFSLLSLRMCGRQGGWGVRQVEVSRNRKHGAHRDSLRLTFLPTKGPDQRLCAGADWNDSFWLFALTTGWFNPSCELLLIILELKKMEFIKHFFYESPHDVLLCKSANSSEEHFISTLHG